MFLVGVIIIVVCECTRARLSATPAAAGLLFQQTLELFSV